MVNPKIRAILLDEVRQHADRNEYISDMLHSPMWETGADAVIPAKRAALLGAFYDAAHCSLREILAQHNLSQTGFSHAFQVPLRTVQHWCNGTRPCPPYVLAMAAEILAIE